MWFANEHVCLFLALHALTSLSSDATYASLGELLPVGSGRVASDLQTLPVYQSHQVGQLSLDQIAWLSHATAADRVVARLPNDRQAVASEASDALSAALAPIQAQAGQASLGGQHLAALRDRINTLNPRDQQDRLWLRSSSLTGQYLQLQLADVPRDGILRALRGVPQSLATDARRESARFKEFSRAWHQQNAMTTPDWVTPEREWAWRLLTDSSAWTSPPASAATWFVLDNLSLRVDATFLDENNRFLGAAFAQFDLRYPSPKSSKAEAEWRELIPDRPGVGPPISDLMTSGELDLRRRVADFAARAEADGFGATAVGIAPGKHVAILWSNLFLAVLVKDAAAGRLSMARVRELADQFHDIRRDGDLFLVRPRWPGLESPVQITAAAERNLWKGVRENQGRIEIASWSALVSAYPSSYHDSGFGLLLLNIFRRQNGGSVLGMESEFCGAVVDGPAGQPARGRLSLILRTSEPPASRLAPTILSHVVRGPEAFRLDRLSIPVFFRTDRPNRPLIRAELTTEMPAEAELLVADRTTWTIQMDYGAGVVFTTRLADTPRLTGSRTTVGEARGG